MKATISIPPGLAYVDGEAVPDTPQLMSVPDAIYHTVHSYPGGVAALAARMGLPVGTLTHKANPNNPTHHMRPDELLAMQHFSGDASVLMAMAAALGYTVTRATPDQSGGHLGAALVRFQVEVADFVRAVGEPAERLAEDPAKHATGNEVRRADYHAQDVQAAMSHTLAALRGRMRTAPKAGG